MKYFLTFTLCLAACSPTRRGSSDLASHDPGSLRSIDQLERSLAKFFATDPDDYPANFSIRRALAAIDAEVLLESYAAIDVVRRESRTVKDDASNAKSILLLNAMLRYTVANLLGTCEYFAPSDAGLKPECLKVDPRLRLFAKNVRHLNPSEASVNRVAYSVWRKAFGFDSDVAESYPRWVKAIAAEERDDSNQRVDDALVSLLMHPGFVLN